MPLIKKLKKWVGEKEIPADIYYSTKTRTFFIKLPDFVGATIRESDVHAETEEEVVRLFQKALHRYQEAVQSKEKVILYDWRIDAYIKRGGVVVLSDSDGFSHSGRGRHDLGVMLKYLIATKVSHDGKDAYYDC